MIDFHSHIIPGVDDGSANMAMSCNMLENAKKEGTRVICATPHYIPEEYEISKEDYEERLFKLRNEVKDIEILSGLEVYINPNLVQLYKEGSIWPINYKKYMLIELPMREFPIYTERVFYELRLQGITPIIAHPERNLSIIKNEELLVNLIEQGNLAQMNAGSLTGIYGEHIKKFAEKLLERNLVHVLGSDGHNDNKRRTDIKKALDIIKEKNFNVYEWIISNEERILKGEEVDILEIKMPKKRKLFGIFNIR